MKEAEKRLARQQGEEQRQYPRQHLMLKVEGRGGVEEAGDAPFKFHGHTRDVSLRGLCISADHNPGINIGRQQQFKVTVQLFQNEPPIEMLGKLCWVKEFDQSREDQSTRIGLELLGFVDGPRGYDRWIERISWN